MPINEEKTPTTINKVNYIYNQYLTKSARDYRLKFFKQLTNNYITNMSIPAYSLCITLVTILNKRNVYISKCLCAQEAYMTLDSIEKELFDLKFKANTSTEQICAATNMILRTMFRKLNKTCKTFINAYNSALITIGLKGEEDNE